MKFFAILFVLCGIVGFALAASPVSSSPGTRTTSTGTGSYGTGTGSVGSGSGTIVETTTRPPCGNGLCGLIPPCLGGSNGCGQKLYIFN